MIPQIENSEATEAARTQAPRPSVEPATVAGKNFATVLAREKKSAAATAPHDKAAIVTPEHEVWRPVRGDDHYARIIEGPRAGMYINLSRGERRGQVFKVEMRDGKRVHVYGEGDKQVVIDAKKDSGYVPGNHGRAKAASAPKAEQWAPVKGANNYADILSGPRNGYYVNTSGGVRDGMVFHIVRKGSKTYHVYGTGANQQMIEVATPKKEHKAHATPSANNGSTGATGGVRPPIGGTPAAT